MKTQYQYYVDGSLKFADDILDQRFDRAFSYDHVSKVKEAYSAGDARDYVNGTSGGAPGPYRQSYQRDVFGNLNDAVYVDRRIIGLLFRRSVYDRELE